MCLEVVFKSIPHLTMSPCLILIHEFLSRDGLVVKMDDHTFFVLSQKGSNSYTVDMKMEDGSLEYRCTCLQFALRKNMCKHIYAAAVAAGKEEQLPANSTVQRKKLCKVPSGRPRRQRPVKKRKIVE